MKPISGSINREWPGTCWHADESSNGFYYLNLESIQPIKEIFFYGRSDCCSERNDRVEIYLDGKLCYRNNGNF